MPSAVDANAGRQVDGMMFDAQVARRASKRFAAIGAKHDIVRDERLQGGGQGHRSHGVKHTIHRRPGAITSDQYRHLLLRESTLGGLAAAFPGFSLQPAPLSLERQQEHRFVRLGNAG